MIYCISNEREVNAMASKISEAIMKANEPHLCDDLREWTHYSPCSPEKFLRACYVEGPHKAEAIDIADQFSETSATRLLRQGGGSDV